MSKFILKRHFLKLLFKYNKNYFFKKGIEESLLFHYLEKVLCKASFDHRHFRRAYSIKCTSTKWFRRFSNGDIDVSDQTRETESKYFEDAEL